ncbi:hypothetical protein BT93_L1503 [Corymbia citriodora subsp. variegata]|uniref:Glycosyltransferase n=1 Tax=Corymbia citriodora subsp. variegata TaxID=360336 RepID=A0A8T0CMK4_CORYI|nr:hypothetical protein BT93_L1503 [Corymbia citriodora subsp. variegata]
MSASAEIFVVSGPGAGHLHPCTELCLLLTRHGYRTTLVISSRVSSDIPPSFASNPLITVAPIAASFHPRRRVSDPHNQSANQELSAHLEKRTAGSELPRVLCAVVDLKVWTAKEVFRKFDVPVISFFTFGACAAAMGLGSWRARISDVQPGEARLIPQLPEEMAVTYSDLKRKPGPTGGDGPPKPGDQPTWVLKVEGSIGLMLNTCADLERPFLDYMGDQMKMPVWGVGPLLPEQYWKTSGSPISDREIRQHTHESSCTEDEVIQWLDCKPRRSVLYVAFGSEMGPEEEEMVELAAALEETTRDFIWHIGPPRYGADFSDRVESKVGDRSVIIKGWAPQLLILSHPSTGGFLSHCGWNSTVEAIGLGVPLLAWPIIGDEYYNAKLVVSHLQVGYRVAEDMSQVVKKDEIVTGIERLMCDEEMHERAASIKAKFGHGFPASSSAFDAFRDFINARL